MEIKLLEMAQNMFNWNYDNLNIDILSVDKEGIRLEACTPANIMEIFISAENLNIIWTREKHANAETFYTIPFKELNDCPDQYRAMAILWAATGNNIDNE